MKHGKILIAAAILTFCFLLAMNAASRAQQPPVSCEVQLQSSQQGYMAEINNSFQLRTTLIQTQQALATARDEIKRLTDKYEPKKAEDKQPEASQGAAKK